MELYRILFSEMYCHCHYSNPATSEGVKGSDTRARVCIKNEAVFYSNFVNKLICSHGANGACITLIRSSSGAGAACGALLCARVVRGSWWEALRLGGSLTSPSPEEKNRHPVHIKQQLCTLFCSQTYSVR